VASVAALLVVVSRRVPVDMAVNPGDPDMAALSTAENLAGNY